MESAYGNQKEIVPWHTYFSSLLFCLTHSHLSVVCLLVYRLLCLHTDEDYLASISMHRKKFLWIIYFSFLLTLNGLGAPHGISINISLWRCFLGKKFFIPRICDMSQFLLPPKWLCLFNFYCQGKTHSSATHCYDFSHDKEIERERRSFFLGKTTLISLGRDF